MAEFIDKMETILSYQETVTPLVAMTDRGDREFVTVVRDSDVVAFLEQVKPADVRPVVRGRWILDSDPGEPWKYKCDQCGEVTNNTCMGKPRYNYCPMCGAYMSENDA